MNEGKRARPRWWSRPREESSAAGAPDVSRTPTAGPEAPGGGEPPGASPERLNPAEPVSGPVRWRTLSGALLIALLAGATGGLTGTFLEEDGGIRAGGLPQASAETASGGVRTVAQIAQAALPGVVYIHVKAGGDESTGTGIVLDGDGHILTNNHVVQPATSGGGIDVTFNGGTTQQGSIVGRDNGYDLAVVQVQGLSGLKPLALGDSGSVHVGDPVVAIGAPFDLEGTVTSGIVSAKDRAITAGGGLGGGSVSYVDAIQTDAPINPGNSGGPLMNGRGQVIGINSAIRSADTGDLGGQGGSIGLGFAIPVNEAKRVAGELISDGHATHPVLGVTINLRYRGEGAQIAAKGPHGAPAVTPDGPGDHAGLRTGDVITQVDGVPVHSGQELIVRIRSRQPGERLRLTVRRGDSVLSVNLVLGDATGD